MEDIDIDSNICYDENNNYKGDSTSGNRSSTANGKPPSILDISLSVVTVGLYIGWTIGYAMVGYSSECFKMLSRRKSQDWKSDSVLGKDDDNMLSSSCESGC